MERCRMYGKHKEAEDARSSTERMVKFLQCHLSSAFVSDTSAPTSPFLLVLQPTESALCLSLSNVTLLTERQVR